MDKCLYQWFESNPYKEVTKYYSIELKTQQPMTLLLKSMIPPLFFDGINQTHFLRIDSTDRISLYLICNGEKDMDWMLEDIKYEASMNSEALQLWLYAGKEEACFNFCINDFKAIYSIIKIALQNEICVYYLMDQKEHYCYLGYQQLQINDNIKKQILNDVYIRLKSVGIL
ncbi:hypothetical protein [Alkaliphilus peptidifermentans]|uniref:Uncharacterized protein n=1 Tax=Alkaliphilus peptidifermentans DSM 18978 TaxID=1120976 RepID=A0A1G5HUE0_9FIRM|nr:hypothetical protein [Alkaliphilus peptidifermentans]SCY66638.1 hypothetical protein SAMN03080606_02111 [Alkaliphilus peptidifermentans DSM 18978]